MMGRYVRDLGRLFDECLDCKLTWAKYYWELLFGGDDPGILAWGYECPLLREGHSMAVWGERDEGID